MTEEKMVFFLTTQGKYFPTDRIFYIQEQLKNVEDSKLMLMSAMEYHDPTVMLLVSIFLGTMGIDRFLMGDIGMGFLKLFTGGLCGILTIIDWFTVMQRSREKNFQKLISVI